MDKTNKIPEPPAISKTLHIDARAPAPRTSPDGLRKHLSLEEAKALARDLPIEPGPYGRG